MTLITNTKSIITHPFRAGVQGILEEHFDPSITKNFILNFEADVFSADASPHIWKQRKDNNFVMEVHYRNPDGTAEFICDVYSWESRPRTSAHLLRHITDKVKTGKIGFDWGEKDGKLSAEVFKHETPDALVDFGTVKEKVNGEV